MPPQPNRRCACVTWIAAIRPLALAGALATATATARPAVAQNAGAETLFREGGRLMEAGRLAEACAAFEASNRIDPRAGTLIRLGDCLEARGRLASAWSAYTAARARARDPRKQQLAARRIAALEPRLSQLTIIVPRPRRLDGLVIVRDALPVDPALWNRPHPVDGGPLRIAVRAPGHVAWETSVDVPLEGGKVRVEVPALTAAPVAAPEVAAVVTARPEGGDGLTGKRTTALALVGIGAVAAGGAAVLGWQARQLAGDADDVCPHVVCAEADRANRLVDRAHERALFANIGFAVAGAAVVGAAVLWITGGPDRPGVAVSATVDGHAAGAAVTGRF